MITLVKNAAINAFAGHMPVSSAARRDIPMLSAELGIGVFKISIWIQSPPVHAAIV